MEKTKEFTEPFCDPDPDKTQACPSLLPGLPFLTTGLLAHWGPQKSQPSKAPTPGPEIRPADSPAATPTGPGPILTWGARQAALGLPALGLPRPVAIDTPLCLVAAPEEERSGPTEAQPCCCRSGPGHVPPGPQARRSGRDVRGPRPQGGRSRADPPRGRWEARGERRGEKPAPWTTLPLLSGQGSALGANPDQRPAKPSLAAGIPRHSRGPRGWGRSCIWEKEGCWGERTGFLVAKLCMLEVSVYAAASLRAWPPTTPLKEAPERRLTRTMRSPTERKNSRQTAWKVAGTQTKFIGRSQKINIPSLFVFL